MRGAVALVAALALMIAVAACGGGGDSGTEEASTDAGFVGAKPEPGTSIPAVSVKLGMRPYADNAFEYLGIEQGFYEDNGISIEPPPYGIKNNENAISQMLNGTVDIQTMYAPSLIPPYKTDDSLKQIMFTDYFNGYALLAAPDLNLKTVTEYMEEGVPFKQAMKQALAPMEGKTLVVSPLIDGRPFAKLAFEIAEMPQPELQILEDSKSLIAARAGQEEFAEPTGAPTTLQLESEGWTPLVTPRVIIENSTGGASSPAAVLAGHVGLASRSDYINSNPNTILRFVSATYRLIDQIEKEPEVLDQYAPYLNSLTGLELSGEEIAVVFKELDPLTNFEFGKTYCVDKGSILNYQNSYEALIRESEAQHVVDEGQVTPDEMIWACQIWSELNSYKKKTEGLLAKAEQQGGADQKLLAEAKALFDQFNYLDSYRFALAASE